MIDENLSGANDAVIETNQEEAVETPIITEEPARQEENIEVPADGEEGKKHKPGGYQRKAMRLEREKAELEAQLKALTAPRAVADREPRIDDYNTYDAYNKAAIEWHVQQQLKVRDDGVRQAQERERQESADRTWKEKIDALPPEYDDYEDVVGNAFRGREIKPELFEAVTEAGPEVVYHIAKDTALRDELLRMTPMQAMREIIKLEARVGQKPLARVSKAPPPINPVKRSVSTAPDLASADTDSYISMRLRK